MLHLTHCLPSFLLTLSFSFCSSELGQHQTSKRVVVVVEGEGASDERGRQRGKRGKLISPGREVRRAMLDGEEKEREDSGGRRQQSGRWCKWRGSGKENEGWDRGNVALFALDPGDLIIICPPPPLLPPQRGREREREPFPANQNMSNYNSFGVSHLKLLSILIIIFLLPSLQPHIFPKFSGCSCLLSLCLDCFSSTAGRTNMFQSYAGYFTHKC